MTTTTKVQRVNVNDAAEPIRARQDFNWSARTGRKTASLYGFTYRHGGGAYICTGRLPQEWAQRLRDDSPTYVVFSYGTPIAWIASDGTPVVPDARYSVTTSHHQGMAAVALLGSHAARTTL